MIPDLPLSPEELAALDKAHVWHPFTHMKPYIESDPVVIWRGEGVRLQDTTGRWYYDGVSSIWLNVHGHHVPAIDAAIREQLERVAHATLLGQGNVPATLLARRLVEIAPPGLTRVFYSDSGATAVEIALKMAIQFWSNQGNQEKRAILGFSNNYHGDTFGAMAVAPDELFHWPFMDMLPHNPRAPYPVCHACAPGEHTLECGRESLAVLEQTLAAEAARLAAVIIEPVQGAGGIFPAPPGYLQELRALCDRYGVLLIVDEVATGFGRTGALFACTSEGITPDILCLGKGLSGGYLPLAATMATERIFEVFLAEPGERKTLFHGHSFTGNPLACAAGLASLDLLQELLPALPEKAELLLRELAPLRERPWVAEVRVRGLMAGLQLAAEPATRRPFPYGAQAGWSVGQAARRRGMLIRPIGNTVIFMPPLASSQQELQEMVAILRAALEDAAPELAALARAMGA